MIVSARDLCKNYRRGQENITALRNVNLDIEAGAFVFVVGPSGGGKSSLLHLLGGMDVPTSGQLLVNGVALDHASETQLNHFRREQTGFVFQFYNLLASLSALENVSLPLLARGKSLKEAHAMAAHMLDMVGLSGRINHRRL
jgi:ABC-type lipoprotein export system ATPase subunit